MGTTLPNSKTDARRVFGVLVGGGVAIIPLDVGYGIVATDPAALERAFSAKQRKPHKRHAMLGSYALHRELHVLPELQERMVRLLTQDLKLPMGVIAPFNKEHPLIQKLGEETLARSSVDGTLSILINGGELLEELVKLTFAAGLPLMGSSANQTGTGTKILVEDIEPDILSAADIVIDYGRQKYSYPRPSTTMFDFKNMALVRYGCCFDVFQDVFKRFFGISLPDDPGRGILFSGHVAEAARQY